MSGFTTTPNLGLFKPNYAQDRGQWGNHWNANADKLDQAIGPNAPFLPIAGGTMTGPLTLAANPTTPLGAATKQYVDSIAPGGPFLPISGGQMTGLLTLSGPPTAANHAATKAYADTMTPLAGGTMTGLLTLSGPPTLPLQAVTKAYADAIIGTGKITLTQPANGATITIADGKTLTANNTLAFSGTDGTTFTFPATSGTVGTLNTTQAWTGQQFFYSQTAIGNATAANSLSMNGPIGSNRTIAFVAAGAARWQLTGLNNAATAVPNSDTDFTLGAFTDAGVFNGFPLTAHRASGPFGNGVPTLFIGPWAQGGAAGRGQATIPNGLVGNYQDLHLSGDLQPALSLPANPITTTSGSPDMIVTYPNVIAQHTPGFDVWVLFTGVTAVGGITPNGTWVNVNNNIIPRIPTAGSWAAGNITVTTSQNHGIRPGQVIINTGFTPAGYNGTFTTVAGTAGNTLVFAAADPGGAATVMGATTTFGAPAFLTTAATWASGNITFTTSVPHGISVGQQIVTYGFTPAGYNGTFTAIAGTTGSTVVVIATNPGAATFLGLLYDPNKVRVTWTANATSTATGGGSVATMQPSFAVQCNKSVYNVFTGANGFSDKNIDIYDVQPMWYQSQAANTGSGAYQQNWFVCMGPPDKTQQNLWGVNWAEIDLVNRGSDDGYNSNLYSIPRNQMGIWMGPTDVLANTSGSAAANWNTAYAVFSGRGQGLGVYCGYSVQRNGLVPAAVDPTGHGGVGVDIFGSWTTPGQNPYTTAASGNSVRCQARFPTDMRDQVDGALVYFPQRVTVSGVTFGGNAPQTLTLANNPITTASGSPLLTIAMPNAGKQLAPWSTITIAGATGVGGITPNGTMTVLSTAPGSFTAMWTANATSGAVGGGAAVVLGFNSSVYVMSSVNTTTGFFTIFGSGNSAGVVSGGGNGQIISFENYTPYAPWQGYGTFNHGLIFEKTFHSYDGMAVSAPAGNGYGWNGTTGATAMVTADDDNAGNMNLILTPAGNGIIRHTGPVALPSYRVALLPPASAAYKGCMACVTDATAPAWNAAVTGGGSVTVPVFCDGAAWLAH